MWWGSARGEIHAPIPNRKRHKLVRPDRSVNVTLVITEASRKYIVMVGDSAVTTDTSVRSGCRKVQYSKDARVGFSMWGAANIQNKLLDQWLDTFISNTVSGTDTVDSVACRLATELNAAHSRYCREAERTRGLHVAGFVDGPEGNKVPRVYHVRTDASDDSFHHYRAYLDYPDGVGDVGYKKIIAGEKFLLRNGRNQTYNAMLEGIEAIGAAWRGLPAMGWPTDTAEDRCAFLKFQIECVAGALKLANQRPSVDAVISTLVMRADSADTYDPRPLSAAPPAQSPALTWKL
jgi:hypothetical protein